MICFDGGAEEVQRKQKDGDGDGDIKIKVVSTNWALRESTCHNSKTNNHVECRVKLRQGIRGNLLDRRAAQDLATEPQN